MTEFRGWAGARERLAERPPEKSPPPPDAVDTELGAAPADDAPGSSPDAGTSPGPDAQSEPAVDQSEPAVDQPVPESGPEPMPDSGPEEDGQVDDLVDEAEEKVETDLDELERLAAERDDYVERLQRLQADFQNYRKRIIRQQTEHLERAAEDIVEKLLEVLDNFDLAMAHGGTEHLEPVYRSLMGVLEGTGLERLDPTGQPFDPQEHEAVMHEPGEDGTPEVAEVMRPGYRWKGRLLRPAMVKVKG